MLVNVMFKVFHIILKHVTVEQKQEQLTTTVVWIRGTLKHILFTKRDRIVTGFNGKVAFNRCSSSKRPTGPTTSLVYHGGKFALLYPINLHGKAGHIVYLKVGWFLLFSCNTIVREED